MATPSSQFFYFYRRYRWRAADFTTLQQTISDMARGPMEGAFAAAVLSGLDVTPGGAMNLSVSPGIATSATGYLMPATGTSVVAVTAPTGVNSRKDLVVIRPVLTDNTTITSPTSPFSNVPLQQTQGNQIVLVGGTPAASPAYPATQANDVVLAGITVAPGTVTLTDALIDYVARDREGKNSNLGGMQNYDFIVSSTRKLRTHSTLAKLLADSALVAGSRVLVAEDQTVTATLSVVTPNVAIDFLPGVSLNKSGAATGMTIAASGVQLNRPRFSGFSGGSDVALGVIAGGEYCVVERGRFKNCTNEIVDLSTSGAAVVANHTEV